MSEAKKECPKIGQAVVQSSNPKTEVRRLEYDDGCPKQATCPPTPKRAGIDSCEILSQEIADKCDKKNLIKTPPAYGDLGKNARDIFDKGFHFGLIKLDMKTKTAAGVEFQTGGVSNQEDGQVKGALETKYKCPDFGLTFAEKWSTENKVGTEVFVEDKLMAGLKLGTNFVFSPVSGEKNWINSLGYASDSLNLSSSFDVGGNGSVADFSAVFGYFGWLVGYQGAFDVEKKEFSKNNFALGFSTADFILHTNVNGASTNEAGEAVGQEFGGSIYQRVNPRLETGIQLAWSSSSNDTKFGIGAKYFLDKDATIRAKINNATQIGIGYQQRLRDGITLTLSAMIDGKNFNTGGHKIGLALELES